MGTVAGVAAGFQLGTLSPRAWPLLPQPPAPSLCLQWAPCSHCQFPISLLSTEQDVTVAYPFLCVPRKALEEVVVLSYDHLPSLC